MPVYDRIQLNEVINMRKMLIGLTERCSVFNADTRRFYNNESYFQYVGLGGGIPVMLGTVTEETADDIAAALDGLVITGGEDIDPAYYGEENTHSSLPEADVDSSDMLLYHAFRRAHKPVLGICRGIQVINVAEGGTLYQDIPSDLHTTVEHNQRNMDPPRGTGETAHSCTFCEDTVLHDIFGDTHTVNSYHHQAIKDPASSLTVSAYSEDGIIEGVEKEQVLAVQWHPERLVHDEKHVELIRWLIKACQENSAQ